MFIKNCCLYISLFWIVFPAASWAQKRENLSINIGDEINIISEKAFRNIRQKTIEAVGNVVIKHKEKTLFGESAHFDFKTALLKLSGNVRYVGTEFTIYGSSLSFDLKDKRVIVKSGRIISGDFTVIGEKLTKESDDLVVGEEAEYTTCKDCPESWSVFGKRVRIYLGQYIHVYGAYLKINGVTVLYLPYIVFPIKKGRETGLLFPSLSFSNRDGMSYQQPWFWAINAHSDATLSPFLYSKRGWGGDVEYRHIFGENKWFQVNSLSNRDRIYQPGKENDEITGQHFFRNFTSLQHQWSIGNVFNHHMQYNFTRDMDIVRDFESFTKDHMVRSEFGGGGFFDFTFPHVVLTSQAYFMRNPFIGNARAFDHHFVQILPRLDLTLQPFSFLHSSTPGIRKLSFGMDAGMNIFRQNRTLEQDFIRNAKRLSVRPYFDWNIVNLGPASLKTTVSLDSQFYNFPQEESETSFRKYANLFKTEFSFEVDKVYGLAYQESVPAEDLDSQSLKKAFQKKIQAESLRKRQQEHLIGEIPPFEESLTKDVFVRQKNSYRHAQEYKFTHYYTTNQKTEGSPKFFNQIQETEGIFDNEDVLLTNLSRVGGTLNLQEIPRKNTLEFQWNNSLIRKEAKTDKLLEDGKYLRQNFNYARLAYFNLSQGILLNSDAQKLKERVSRLNLATGISINGTSLSLGEYYFYDRSDHIFDASLSRQTERFLASFSFIYNTRSNPRERYYAAQLSWRALSWMNLTARYEYDFVEDTTVSSTYLAEYIPTNNCWKIDFGYSKNEVDQRVVMNFYLNFGRNVFTPVTGYSSDPRKL